METTTLAIFARSLLIGFSIAAPVGPIGVLVIRRTLSEGRIMGLVTGLGAAAADALYGAVGAFGLSLVTAWLVDGAGWLRLAGGQAARDGVLGGGAGRAVFAERLPLPVAGVAGGDDVVGQAEEPHGLGVGGQDRAVAADVDDAARHGVEDPALEVGVVAPERRLGHEVEHKAPP